MQEGQLQTFQKQLRPAAQEPARPPPHTCLAGGTGAGGPRSTPPSSGASRAGKRKKVLDETAQLLPTPS